MGIKTMLAGGLALSAVVAAAGGAVAALDPRALIITPPANIKWNGEPGKTQTAVLYGDPTKAGSLYVQLVKWPANAGSRPHYHKNDRYITVLEGTWWVNTGRKYQPDGMTPVKAGSFVLHTGGEVHYDGTKGEGALIEIIGMGPADLIPAEDK